MLLVYVSISACAPPPRIPDTSAIQSEIRGLLELHTYEHVYRNVVYFGEERSVLFFRTMDRSTLFSINITVRAGLDLSEDFEILPDSSDPERIVVVLPRARVLGVDADEGSIQEFFVREQGGQIQRLEYADAIAEVKEDVEADAVERGILIRAEENAQRLVTNFLELAGYQEVIVGRAAERSPEGDLPGVGDAE